jgi:uncharacterized protein YjdB
MPMRARFLSLPPLRIVMVASLLLAAGCAAGRDGDAGIGVVAPASITLPAPAITLASIGGTDALNAVVRDANGAALPTASVSWHSDAPAVAIVSGSGASATVTATGRGVAVVTARSSGLTGSVTVFVRTPIGVTVLPDAAAVRVGGSTSLVATVRGEAGVSAAVTWSSASPTVASVGADGVVTGVSIGTTVVTARSVSDPRVTGSATITVTPARGLRVAPAEVRLGRDESRPVTADVTVGPGESTDVTWRSSRPLVATVSDRGIITGVSVGDAIITARSVADTTLRDSVRVRVMPIVRSIVVVPENALLRTGQTLSFTAVTVVDSGIPSTIAWSSTNPAVATIDAAGVATAVGLGTTTIRARAVADTSRVAVATLRVEPRPVQLLLGTRALGLTIGRTSNLSATVAGDPGISTEVMWSSRDPAVATVSASGLVTATGRGVTHLIAQAVADPNARDSLVITVTPQLATAWRSDRLGGPLIEDVVSLWAINASLAYAVNAPGDLYRWDGTAWTVAARGAQFNTNFTAVHGVTPEAITAVGTRGVIVRFDGTSWTAMSSGTTTDLADVWMTGPRSAWAVGSGGVALRLRNDAWSPTDAGTTATLRAVSGSDTEAFAVGDGGTVRRYVQERWVTVPSGTTEVLRDVLVPGGGGAVYASGNRGIVLRWTGQFFERETSGTTAPLLALASTSGGGVLASGDGIVLTRTLTGWREEAVPYRTRFSAVAVEVGGALWIGGQRGLVLRSDPGGAWSTLSLTPDLLDVWRTSATHALAVGELGFIFRYDGAAWTRQPAPSLERLNTVWAASPDVAFAGGDNGELLRWNGTTWSRQTSPTTAPIYAMWGADADAVWAVAEGGEILRWDGATWRVEQVVGSTLYAVHGTSRTDVSAVGLDGAAFHWDGTRWSARNTGTSHLLVGVWSSASGTVLAVGARDFASGVAIRYDGSRWTNLPLPTSRVPSAVWGAVETDVYAVGDQGSIMRFDGTGWQLMTAGSTEFLWAISGAPDAVGGGLVVGVNGTVLRAETGSAAAARTVTASGVARRGTLEPARGVQPRRAGALPSGAARRRRGG